MAGVGGLDAVEPNIWKLKKVVVPEVKAHWEDLAYSMDYEIAQVEALKRDGKDVGNQCGKLFEDWLKTSNGCTPKTWGTLIKRIRDVDELYAAAERIQKKILGAGKDNDDPGPPSAPKVASIPTVDKLSEKPEMADLNRIVVEKVMMEWEKLAQGFRYADEIIARIKQQNRENAEDCCREFFRDWRNTDHGIRAGPKTWTTLFTVIKDYTSIATDTREKMIEQVKQLN